MASPMRKKRAWSTPEDDAESRESAAFEASVAAAKDTAAKSGAFLSSAKEDLTDHQRWLRTQSAAVEKDRLRHERWLQRQHDQESAALRKERISRRRRLMRQRAVQAVEQAALDLALFIRSWIAFAFGKSGDGFKFVGLSIGRGFALVGQTIAMSLRWTGAKFGIAFREAGKGLSAGSSAVAAEAGKLSQGAGRSIGGGLSTARTKGAGIASTTGRAVANGSAILAAKLSAGGAVAKRSFSSMSASTKSRAAAIAPALYVQVAKFGHNVQDFTRARAPGAKPPLPATPEVSPNEPREVFAKTESAASPSWLHGIGAHAAILTSQARAVAGRAGAWVGAKTASAWHWAKLAAWVSAEALVRARVQAQKRARTRGLDLSQMMIVAGAVLLLCGGLLVGGGLLMRAGARAPVTAEVPDETFSGITWMFNEPDLPLPDRAVFTLSGTPEAFLINGLSISGINNSDQTLTSLQGVLKPDVQRPDLRLSLQVVAPASPARDGTQAPPPEGLASTVLPSGAVPAHTPFRLVFPFPPEAMDGADGISTEEFFDSYGGLFLTLRYEIDGVEKSVFQYLAPDMLKAQLDEVPEQAGDS